MILNTKYFKPGIILKNKCSLNLNPNPKLMIVYNYNL
jgi:hypothetical protein